MAKRSVPHSLPPIFSPKPCSWDKAFPGTQWRVPKEGPRLFEHPAVEGGMGSVLGFSFPVLVANHKLLSWSLEGPQTSMCRRIRCVFKNTPGEFEASGPLEKHWLIKMLENWSTLLGVFELFKVKKKVGAL